MTEHITLDTRIFRLLPEVLLPSQLPTATLVSPEKRFWFAQLHDVWENLKKYQGRNNRRAVRVFQEDLDWIESAEDGLLSFIWVCDVVGLDASGLRRGMVRELARMQEQGVQQRHAKQRRAA